MTFCPTKVSAGLLFMVVLGVFPVRAQNTIQFTKPVSDVTATANSFMTEDAQRKKATPGSHNAPSSLFGNSWLRSDYDVLPGVSPAPAVSPAEAQQWKKLLEKKNKWAMMTPEEILGLPTPEKIMGLPDKYGEENLSPEERFLKRQERATFAATHRGSQRQNDFLTRGNPASLDAAEGGFGAQPGMRPGAGSASYYNQSLSAKPGMFGVGSGEKSIWSGGFTMPSPPPQQTPEQLAGMERFRALMEPTSPPDRPVPTRSVAGKPDSNLQPVPLFNPLGHTAAPLPSSFKEPTGIKPLPGLTEKPSAPVVARPERQAKPPPWLSEDEDSPKFGLPRRKF